jgi:FkbM family methyltransferase
MILSVLKKAVNLILNCLNAQVVSLKDFDKVRRSKIIDFMQINKVFDVGANVGNYGLELRKYNFNGLIYSFEPIREVFSSLEKKTQKDNSWQSFNFALGNEDTRLEINISQQSDTSSILEVLPKQLENAPTSKYVRKEFIELKRFDSIFDNLVYPDDKIMLKIDTQGYEMNVLKGALTNITKISIIQLELSLVELYQSETLFDEMIEFLKTYGFKLYSIENGFSSPSNGRLLQFDGIFVNENLIPNV